MAVVLGTALTLASVLSMAASAGGAAADIAKIAEDLRSKGHDPAKSIPVDAQLAVQKALDTLPQPLPIDFGSLAAADQQHVTAALSAVRAVYIANEAVGDYRAKALAALYALAEYLDAHP